MIPQLITSLLGGPIINALLKGYRASLDAKNTREKYAADLAIREIKGDIEARRHAKEIRLATAGFWEMRLLTFAIAFPFVSHLWAVWLDTQFRFGWGIPKFPEPMDGWQGAILLSFFGVYGAMKGIQTIGAAIAMRTR